MGLQDLADTTGLNKATAYRLLRVLQEEAYVTRASSGGYLVGARLTGLASEVLPGTDVFVGARPVLRDLADLSGETATLHLRAGDDAVLVLGAECDHELRSAARLGSTTPLHRGCSGQAILAHLPDAELDAILKRANRGIAEVEAALSSVRREGFALSQGANHPGIRGVAVPILTPTGDAVASVAVSGPAERWTVKRAVAFAQVLSERRQRLSLLFQTRHPVRNGG